MIRKPNKQKIRSEPNRGFYYTLANKIQENKKGSKTIFGSCTHHIPILEELN